MTDNIVNFPSNDKPLDPLAFIVGPFDVSYVQIEGRKIPNLTAQVINDGEDVNLIIDGRFAICVPAGRAYDIAWLVAQGMAVAAGYPHLGAEDKHRPFAPKFMQIGAVSIEDENDDR